MLYFVIRLFWSSFRALVLTKMVQSNLVRCSAILRLLTIVQHDFHNGIYI